MKVCINKQYGGFRLSDFALEEIKKRKGCYIDSYEIDRHDKDLIDVISEFGDLCNTFVSTLVLVEIPDGVDYVIDDYDGLETIHERHRVWG